MHINFIAAPLFCGGGRVLAFLYVINKLPGEKLVRPGYSEVVMTCFDKLYDIHKLYGGHNW